MDLSVCLIATEIFAWGRYGGFGSSTRAVGSGLAERGVEVSAVVPLGQGQKPVEELDGMTVYGFSSYKYPLTGHIYRRCDADVYHSEEPSWGSKIAMDVMPERGHIVTSQNPRTREDWRRVNRFCSWKRRVFNAFLGGMIAEAVRRMDAVYCQAQYIIPKVKELYSLSEDPGFLPNPVEVPHGRPKKSGEPMVCFLGRFDGVKQPELFFELAGRFPEVRFIAMGKAHSEAKDQNLRKVYSDIPNLEMFGFTMGAEKSQVLERSWVLVNTSVSECLPVSFLEAAAHRCAILSFHDPDGFASEFGYHAADGDLDQGLRFLLEEDNWRERGEKGYTYVSKVHERRKVIDQHLVAYEALLERG